MNRRYRKFAGNEPSLATIPVNIPLAVCFSLGLLSGCAMASLLRENADSGLYHYLEHFFSLLAQGEGNAPTLLDTLWEISRWPLLAALLGTTAFGVLAVPALLLIRGFLLAYAIAVFIRFYGGIGLVLATAVFGASALASVTALFLIGQDILLFKWPGGKGRPFNKETLLFHTAAVLCWLAVGTIAQQWLSPWLLRVAVARLL